MELQNLFVVTLTKNNETVMVSEKRKDYYKQYPQWFGDVVVLEELGKVWAKNAQVEVTGGNTGRCYVSATYKITADEQLNERDMEIIRAQYPFLSGQRTADVKLNNFKEVDGKFEYTAHSECDSSD